MAKIRRSCSWLIVGQLDSVIEKLHLFDQKHISKLLLRARNAFWFDLSAYHNNDSAIVLYWGRQLPAICRGFLRCALEDQWQEFEIIMKRLLHEYLNKEYLEMVKRVFPNMSGDVNKEQSGTITEVARPEKKENYLVPWAAPWWHLWSSWPQSWCTADERWRRWQ